MSLPAFADLEALEAALSGGITEGDKPRAQAALNRASTRIRNYTGRSWVDDDNELDFGAAAYTWAADTFAAVAVASAARALVNPDGVTSETTGPFAHTIANASPDVYLTKQEQQEINTVAGVTGLTSQRVEAPAYASASRLLDLPDALDELDDDE